MATHARTPLTRSATPTSAVLTVSQARTALAIAQRNFEHANGNLERARAARRLAEARLADAVAAALAPCATGAR